jgi:tripartite-type tricarboxylate transporter receptor subunit TctC
MRQFISVAVLALLVVAGRDHQAAAQAYPNKPVKVLVPSGGGGPTDLLARVITDGLSTALGQRFVIENRPAAGGLVAGEMVARSAADGYTLLYANSSTQSINPALYPAMPYDPGVDLTPIIHVSVTPMMLVVNPKFPVNSLQELLAYDKANPGKLSFGHAGPGTLPHLVYEMFRLATKLNAVPVAYNGGAASLSALIANEVPVTFETVPLLLSRVRGGEVRPLAVTSRTRHEDLPDVPTMTESGYPDVLALSWTGVVAPSGTPPEIISLLNTKLNDMMAAPEFRAKMKSLGADLKGGTPADFAAWIAEERTRWTRVVKESGAKPN